MGVATTELWNNLGLCCFYAGQFDMTVSCFERALSLSDDSNAASVWYNVSHVAVGTGDMGLAYQALQVAVAADGNHAESFSNLGVLEMRRGALDAAKTNFVNAARLGPHLFEPAFNAALVCHRAGNAHEAFSWATAANAIFPDHAEGKELLAELRASFSRA